jgi:hypothetical protein
MSLDDELGEPAGKMGDYWNVYKAEAEGMDKIIRYEHPDAMNIAAIHVKKQGRVNWYRVVVNDMMDDIEIASEFTTDFGNISSALYDYHDGRYMVLEKGRGYKRRVINPCKGQHPKNIPIERQVLLIR